MVCEVYGDGDGVLVVFFLSSASLSGRASIERVPLSSWTAWLVRRSAIYMYSRVVNSRTWDWEWMGTYAMAPLWKMDDVYVGIRVCLVCTKLSIPLSCSLFRIDIVDTVASSNFPPSDPTKTRHPN